MEIRSAALREAELLAEMNRDVQQIHTEIAPDIFKEYSKDSMKDLFAISLQDDNKKCFIAFEESEPAGYALFSKVHYQETYFKHAYSVIYIEQICVLKKFKGRCLGKELIRQIKAYAENQGITRIELDYWCKNVDAGQFFSLQGFTPYQEKMFYDVAQ
jgi:diamine N-acetyltransferase